MSTKNAKSQLVSSVRAIPIKSFEGVRGWTAEGQEYESTLEADYFNWLAMSPDVERYTSQPCKIVFQDGGRLRTYTPDVLVEYRQDAWKTSARPPELVEVKPSHIIDGADELMLRKFSAARQYAQDRGWLFRTFTEAHIDPVQFENAKFLRRYANRALNEAYAVLLLEDVSKFERTTIESALKLCLRDDMNRAQLLTELWTLLAQKRIGYDPVVEITMQSQIWSVE